MKILLQKISQLFQIPFLIPFKPRFKEREFKDKNLTKVGVRLHTAITANEITKKYGHGPTAVGAATIV